MTPAQLALPLRPNEAAEVASLIFEQAERNALTDEIRNRIAARASCLKLETLAPYFGSLARDPVHPSAYYLAVDGADAAPLLLYMAVGAAPGSGIFHKPLLIGRMRPMNGPEFVIDATPFGRRDHDNIELFAAKIDTAFLPRPQGSRASIAVASDFPGAFDTFRAIHRRTGKNLAAVSGDYHTGVWAAIRAGWRHEYSAVVEISLNRTTENVRETLAFTRFAVDVSRVELWEPALKAAESEHEEIRQARALLKSGSGFEFEVGLGNIGAAGLECCLESLKTRGHMPQFVTVAAEGDMNPLAAVARMHNVTMGFRFCGEAAGVVESIGKATEGRFN